MIAQGLTAGELLVEDLYERTEPGVMTLAVETDRGESFIGTAFLAFEHDLALTAWHVIHDARRIQARFSNQETLEVVGCVDRDPALDLALIKLARPLTDRPLLPLAASAPRTGASVFMIGAPKGHDFSICSGLLSQQRFIDGVFHYQLACPISSGNSGGPVLNRNGEVVGLVSWKQVGAESLGFAIPSASFGTLTHTNALVGWAGVIADTRPTVENGSRLPAQLPVGNSGDLDRFLKERLGQTITVVEEGRTYRFEISEGPRPKE